MLTWGWALSSPPHAVRTPAKHPEPRLRSLKPARRWHVFHSVEALRRNRDYGERLVAMAHTQDGMVEFLWDKDGQQVGVDWKGTCGLIFPRPDCHVAATIQPVGTITI